MKHTEQSVTNERGDIAVEALLGLVFFILTAMGVLMLSMLMRLESSTQYALDQTAKEISQYFYIIEKLDILPENISQKPEAKNLDNTIKEVKALAGNADSIVADVQEGGFNLETLQKLVEDLKGTKGNAEGLSNTLTSTDWKAEGGTVLNLMLRSAGDRMVGAFVANPVCKGIFPKYMPVEKDKLDSYLKANGIKDGRDGLNFSGSTLLSDGFSINAELTYTVDLGALTFNAFKIEVPVRQVARTAAWIHYHKKDDPKPTHSLWEIENPLTRGETINDVQQNTDRNYGKNLADGTKFDCYDPDTNTLTEFMTLNVNNYRNEDGTIDEDKLAKNIKGKLSSHNSNSNNLKADKVKYEDGSAVTGINENTNYQVVIVMPEQDENTKAFIDKTINEYVSRNYLNEPGEAKRTAATLYNNYQTETPS